jgi:hypothetical protein
MAASMAWATISPVPGWAEWPLTTTGQPAARAEAVSPPAVEKARGKFEAPNTATGPMGRWISLMSGRGAGWRSGRAASWRRSSQSSLQDVAGEEAELHGGATAFALQPGGGEAGFLGADLGDLCAPRLDLVSDAVQEVCPVLAGLGSVGGEGGFGGVTGCVHMGRGADREGVRGTVGRGGGEGLVVPDPVACDQVFSGQHGGLLSEVESVGNAAFAEGQGVGDMDHRGEVDIADALPGRGRSSGRRGRGIRP